MWLCGAVEDAVDVVHEGLLAIAPVVTLRDKLLTSKYLLLIAAPKVAGAVAPALLLLNAVIYAYASTFVCY